MNLGTFESEDGEQSLGPHDLLLFVEEDDHSFAEASLDELQKGGFTTDQVGIHSVIVRHGFDVLLFT